MKTKLQWNSFTAIAAELVLSALLAAVQVEYATHENTDLPHF
jgi:hypothetical protein